MYSACYTRVFCNCGIAIRNGDARFIANFCGVISTNYAHTRNIRNNYVEKICVDDHSMIITTSGDRTSVRLNTKKKTSFVVSI